jgi:hypothetical protein
MDEINDQVVITFDYATNGCSVTAELARLRKRLVAWMDEIGDRLLNPWTRASLLEGRSV